MAGNEGHIVAQRPELLGDRVDQVLVVAHRKIGAPDAALEEHVAHHGELARAVEEHDELILGLSPLLDRINFTDPLEELVPSGTSWVASRNRGYGNDSIALGFYPIVQELKDPNNTEFQELTMMYNLLDFNLYEQDFQEGSQIMVMPRAGIAHMWITKDYEKGILRFNDAALDRQAFADNG